MTDQWSVPVWAALTLAVVLILVVAAAVIALVRVAALHRQVQAMRRTLATAPEATPTRAPDAGVVHDEREYVITHLGDEPGAVAEPGPAPVVRAPLFADIVLRESVVQAAALAHGVRRALTPENRNRIRFEARRATKHSRKQRRADLRAAARQARETGQSGQGSAA